MPAAAAEQMLAPLPSWRAFLDARLKHLTQPTDTGGTP